MIACTDTISNLTGAVFVDLRKEFDTVDHALLLNKLHVYGIRDSEMAWFTNYLNDGSQVVDFQSELSSPCSISSGVAPCCLSYINDMV